MGRFYDFLGVACGVAFLNFHEYFCFAGWAESLRSRPSADKNIKITIPLFSLLNHFGFPAETGFEMKFVVPNEFFFLIE